MFAQIVSLLVSHFFNRMSPEGREGALTTLSMAAARRAFVLVGAALLAMTFFVGGFLTVMTDLILSSRGQEQIYLSPVSYVGFGLIAVSIAGLLVSMRKSLWQAPTAHISVSQAPSPLNEALAHLVLDFVEERKASRITPEAAEAPEPFQEKRSSEPAPVYM